MIELESTVFPIGQPNDAFAQYFDGKSYLSMLSTGAGCHRSRHL